MGYIRKHRHGIRSVVEATIVLFFTLGIAPALMILASLPG